MTQLSGSYSRAAILVLGLVATALLAFTSLLGDSLTFDELAHLTSGMSGLRTGDYRIGPENPPLSNMWAALPLLVVRNEWPGPDSPGWRNSNEWTVGKRWLFELNDGERLLSFARGMIVVLLLVLNLCIYEMGRTQFGRSAGLLAFTLASFSPTLLAHGRLVTSDLPVTLFMCMSMFTCSRLLRRVTWRRLLAACATTGALSVIKFSWPLVLPAIGVMAYLALTRDTPIRWELFRRNRKRNSGNKTDGVRLTSRWQRFAAIFFCLLCVGASVVFSIWACFRFRYDTFIGSDREEAMMAAAIIPGRPPPQSMDEAWVTILSDRDGNPLRGLVPSFVRFGHDHRLLPETYLYGLAYTSAVTRHRAAYLNGEISQTGWRSFFPLAFLMKTPAALLLLLVAGIAAIVRGAKSRNRRDLLAAGLFTFAAVYVVFSVMSHYNIGHRHLVPLYPLVMITAGASARWLDDRLGRWLVRACVAWLIGACAYVHPHYIAYFNELVGGPAQGYRHLADSSLAWGQDMKRLARYAKEHPGEKLILAYLGSGDPHKYGFDCEIMISFFPLEEEPAELTAGTYVIDANFLVGLYEEKARDTFWERPGVEQGYRKANELFSSRVPPDPASGAATGEQQAYRIYDSLRRGRLLLNLRKRKPDDVVGHTLFVFRLTAEDVADLTAPGTGGR